MHQTGQLAIPVTQEPVLYLLRESGFLVLLLIPQSLAKAASIQASFLLLLSVCGPHYQQFGRMLIHGRMLFGSREARVPVTFTTIMKFPNCLSSIVKSNHLPLSPQFINYHHCPTTISNIHSKLYICITLMYLASTLFCIPGDRLALTSLKCDSRHRAMPCQQSSYQTSLSICLACYYVWHDLRIDPFACDSTAIFDFVKDHQVQDPLPQTSHNT